MKKLNWNNPFKKKAGLKKTETGELNEQGRGESLLVSKTTKPPQPNNCECCYSAPAQASRLVGGKKNKPISMRLCIACNGLEDEDVWTNMVRHLIDRIITRQNNGTTYLSDEEES